MSVLRNFKSQKFLSLLSSISGAALGTLTFMILARALSKPDFGVFGTFLAAHTLTDMLRNGIVGRPLIKFLAEANNQQERKEITGSAWKLGWYSSGITGIVGSMAFGLYYWYAPSQEFLLYTLFFLPLMLITLPFNMGTWILNAQLRFDKMIWIRTSMQVVYIAGALIAWYLNFGVWFVFWVFTIANLVPSILSLFAGWDQVKTIARASKAGIGKMWKFGRFTMGTLLGGNLLRSSDIFIIRAFLGAEAVALYQVPLRLVNLIDIPLRALVSFSYPSLSKQNALSQGEGFKQEFDVNAGFAFLLLLPLAVAAFLFAEPLVVLFGGEEYATAAGILKVFAVFMAITSIDRYSGMALDVLNRPEINMKKVYLMLSVNIIGDLIAVQLSNNLEWVAMITIFTFSSGIIFGFYFLKDILPFHFLNWLRSGAGEITRIVNKLVRK